MEYIGYQRSLPDRQSNRPQPEAAYAAPDEKTKTRKELSRAIGDAQEVLISATTVFPFTLFPDTITVDRTKLSIAHRNFFRVAEVMSIRIDDILNVTANVGPLFGAIKITTRFFDSSNEKSYSVNYLTRSDALRLKRIMQGYLIAIQRKVDCSALTTKELARMLDELGQGAPDET
jgi:hypothetical protein